MSNYGLENFLKNKKINFVRSDVGDRYVKDMMQKYKFNLGGEQSGHIILGKFATTGDGLLVALEVLFSMRKGKKASELFSKFKPTPQLLENIIIKDKSIIDTGAATGIGLATVKHFYDKGGKPVLVVVDHEAGRIWSYASKDKAVLLLRSTKAPSAPSGASVCPHGAPFPI